MNKENKLRPIGLMKNIRELTKEELVSILGEENECWTFACFSDRHFMFETRKGIKKYSYEFFANKSAGLYNDMSFEDLEAMSIKNRFSKIEEYELVGIHLFDQK